MRVRKRRWVAVLAVLAVLVAAEALLLWLGPDPATRENYERIRIGMNRVELEAILGPPGDYRTGPTQVDPWARYPEFRANGKPAERGLLVWEGDAGTICCYTETSNYPGRQRFIDAHRVPQSRWENVLWRAKRQWRRWFP